MNKRLPDLRPVSAAVRIAAALDYELVLAQCAVHALQYQGFSTDEIVRYFTSSKPIADQEYEDRVLTETGHCISAARVKAQMRVLVKAIEAA